ncbi:hypothetical protein A1QO_02465 [Vibrio genomosp. F10 str. ZF-129]|uniref:Uncharacterized protein n=1 Tax=Vibrio genomosp. F10 str. ZF-129 TaxID=1187848 RepID=A0A1E5BLD6_9VIBR|nr:hypothetical protein [Vibrio genomosp. F10]OEE38260.1 hypothetical protein A1QO_02465 [Vibrio genomosp. F10 str. ZF-129]
MKYLYIIISKNEQYRTQLWLGIWLMFGMTYVLVTYKDWPSFNLPLQLLFAQVFCTYLSLMSVQKYKKIAQSVGKWYDSATTAVTALLTLSCLYLVFTDTGLDYQLFISWFSIFILAIAALMVISDSKVQNKPTLTLVAVSIVLLGIGLNL